MTFDVHVNLRITLSATARQDFPAIAELRVISNESENQGRWRLVGRQDPRLPRFNDDWHEWRRDPHDTQGIQLLMGKNAVFARLHHFWKGVTASSGGIAWAARLPGGPPPYKLGNNAGWYGGTWGINQHARHGNMPTPVGDDGFVRSCLAALNRDSGWRFDTSSSGGFSGGAGPGGGVVRATLVMKRKEDADRRRWAVVYYAVAFGLTTPGAGVTESTEWMKSGALTPVMTSSGNSRFSVNDMEGSMVAFEAGPNWGFGNKGGGASSTIYLFFGGVYNEGILPDISTLKCGFQVWGTSTSQGKIGTGAGASGFLWIGAATSVTLRG